MLLAWTQLWRQAEQVGYVVFRQLKLQHNALCYAKLQDEGICTWAQNFLTVPKRLVNIKCDTLTAVGAILTVQYALSLA